MGFLPSALNVKVKKFNEARVNGGSNYDCYTARAPPRGDRWIGWEALVIPSTGGGCQVGTPACNPPELRSGPSQSGQPPAWDFLLVTSKKKMNKNPGPSGNQDYSSGEAVKEAGTFESVSGPKRSDNICEDCGLTFPSSRSLGMHRYHRHPVEVNQERITVLQGRRKGWSNGEDDDLRAKADSIWRIGMKKKDLLTHLHVTFPHRTLEALKKRLQHLKWTCTLTPRERQQHSPPRDNAPDQGDPMSTGPTITTEVDDVLTRSNIQQDIPPPASAAIKRGKTVKHWSEDEDNLLTDEATKIWMLGMTKRELAIKLHSHFRTRTVEAIRKRLQTLEWTVPTVVHQREPSPVYRPHSPEGSPTSLSPPPQLAMSPQTAILVQSTPLLEDTVTPRVIQPVNVEQWRKDMLKKAYHSLKSDRFQPEKLRKWILDMLEGRLTKLEGVKLLKEHTALIFPTKWLPAPPLRTSGKVLRSNKQLRRARYATIQRLYKLRRKDAAQTILEGRWKEAYKDKRRVDGLEEYWTDVYAGTGHSEEKALTTEKGEQRWEILSPITATEIEDALKGMRNSAVGMDRVSARDLLGWHQPSLAGFCNIILALETMPSSLANARITFIPKVEVPETPGDYRPIAVSSTLTRALHKILARRMRDTFTFSPLQYAFLQRDGCLEASMLLQALLRRTHERGTPIAMLFLDIAKAFDTVSHNTILEAARSAGTPEPLLNYLANLYEEAEVNLGTRMTKCGRGVRQGDPLSPILFILVMNKAIQAAYPGKGVELGDQTIDAIAYADDLVLVAQNSEDLQLKLDGLCGALRGMGMTLNERKSKAITILKDRRRKCLLLDPHSYSTEDGVIPAMGVLDKQRYLGLDFTWKGKVTPKHTGHLEKMLHEITTAPLKPYQRLDILKVFMVPRLVHELVLGGAHMNTLLKMDKMVRTAVRKWLRLPKDTPLAYLYSPFQAGGLDIPSISTTIPIWQRSRTMKLLSSQNPIERALTELPSFKKALDRVNRPCRVGGEAITTVKEAREMWA